PRAGAGRDEVAAPVRDGGLDVADLEAERLEARGQDVVYTTLPGGVQRAAVDVYDLFEERDRLRLVRLDRLGDSLLGGIELGVQRSGRQERGGGRCSGDGTKQVHRRFRSGVAGDSTCIILPERGFSESGRSGHEIVATVRIVPARCTAVHSNA